MGEQRAAGGAQGLESAGGPDHRVRAVSASGAKRRVQGVRVLGRRVQQPAQVRVQARGKRHGQGADEDSQSAEGRRRRGGRWSTPAAAANGRSDADAAAGLDCRSVLALYLTVYDARLGINELKSEKLKRV